MDTKKVLTTMPLGNSGLRKYIPYVFFNRSSHARFSFTCFPNDNITLGIVKGKEVFQDKGRNNYREKQAITAYLYGLFPRPNTFEVEGPIDEICIEFTPCGFHRFFPFHSKQCSFDNCILQEAFGKDALFFFEKVFAERDLAKRKVLLESFFMNRFKSPKSLLHEHMVQSIKTNGFTRVRDITGYFGCSEKKVYRVFKDCFDLSPQKYLGLLRFRKSLEDMYATDKTSLTCIAHKNGYYDQSHFIKEFRQFTQKAPKELRKGMGDVNGNVLLMVH